ncbi:MAG: hypothetical protein NT166_25995 [Candidatus Aminicenantes bacterium]|nr:hypothetical protein [Candidatus Aminicenantes bacterium]
MGYHEENELHNDDFITFLISHESLQEVESTNSQFRVDDGPLGMYETLPGQELIDDDKFFKFFNAFEGEEFQTYLSNVRFFGKKVRVDLLN